MRQSALVASLIIFTQLCIAAPCDAPAKLKDGWPIEASAHAAGFDAARLCEVLKDFAESKVNFHSLVVERHGRIVAESYKRGKDETIYSLFASSTNFDAASRHDVRSISKSVVSLLWGIAHADGKTPPLNTPVLDLLPDLADLKQQGREAITIAHLLTMSSGLDWNEPNTSNARNDEFGLYWRTSQSRYVFDRPMAARAGTRYNYNGGGTAVLAQLLTERVGMPLPEYARKKLFAPLGITDWEWRNDIRGRPLAFAGLRLRSRDVARIGRMVLGEDKTPGKWQGTQVVPSAWITESLHGQIDMANEPGWQYGFQWWVGTIDVLGTKRRWSAGFGNGGQRLFLVPEIDLVVVITAGEYGKPAIGREAYQLFKRAVETIRE
ncbi:MAG: serine hydrolase [Aeromicrobium sp.]|nr:serine hydrolase [Burkholderiales bacterium]